MLTLFSHSWSWRRNVRGWPEEACRWSCISPRLDSPIDAEEGEGWTANLQSVWCTEFARWRSYILVLLSFFPENLSAFAPTSPGVSSPWSLNTTCYWYYRCPFTVALNLISRLPDHKRRRCRCQGLAALSKSKSAWNRFAQRVQVQICNFTGIQFDLVEPHTTSKRSSCASFYWHCQVLVYWA